MKNNDRIYVTFRKNNNEFVGHSISSEKPTKEELKNWDELPAPSYKKDSEINDQKTKRSSFRASIHNFISAMNTYRNMVATTIAISPVVASSMANRTLGEFVVGAGTLVEDLSDNEFGVYELSSFYFSTLIRRHEEAIAAVNGAQHLPEIATIGLVSAFDAYIGNLLKAVFSLHKEMVFTSEREIKYSDLIKFSSLDEAENYIIDKDVETILRKSHHEQFKTMESKFGIPLTSGLDVWPRFIELCERRNLLTHAGGLVSKQYIDTCKEHGFKTNAAVGDLLETGPQYFTEAVDTISEIGLKLGHVLWRKFAPHERDRADKYLNETCFELIGSRHYKLAASVLDLAVNTFKKHASDSTRRMMVINLANSVRLQGDRGRARQALEKEDWSATSLDYQLCVASVREDFDELCSLMTKMGANGEIGKQEYREWPVFREIRKDQRFKDTFATIFGEPLVIDQKKMSHKEITLTPNAQENL